MDTTYSHADTEDVFRPFVDHEYGARDMIKLGTDSSSITMYFPIRSHNIQVKLTVPTAAEVVLPEKGTLFSLDSLVGTAGHTFTFRTRYLDISRLSGTDLVRHLYTPEETCLDWERDEVGDPKVLFQRYQVLLAQIIGEVRVGDVMEYVAHRINEWDSGPTKTALQIMDELEATGRYEGNCTERETLTRWLLCAGGVRNRVIEGRRFCASRGGLHAWNEFMVTDGADKFWVPIDVGNIPYLREDSSYIHYLHTPLPKVVSKDGGSGGLFDCLIQLDQI